MTEIVAALFATAALAVSCAAVAAARDARRIARDAQAGWHYRTRTITYPDGSKGEGTYLTQETEGRE